MTKIVKLQGHKRRLSRSQNRATKETVSVIARSGEPMVYRESTAPSIRLRELGFMADKGVVSADVKTAFEVEKAAMFMAKI